MASSLLSSSFAFVSVSRDSASPLNDERRGILVVDFRFPKTIFFGGSGWINSLGAGSSVISFSPSEGSSGLLDVTSAVSVGIFAAPGPSSYT
jgi:hypothetical protein